MKPRDFHIGTEVLAPDGLVGKVLFADGEAVWSSWDDSVVKIRHVARWNRAVCKHASDGAPLGEWVPLPISAFLQLQEYTAEDAQEQANDFIRGEAEQ